METFKKYYESVESVDIPEMDSNGEIPMEWYTTPLKPRIIAYHGGSNFDDFSLDYLGQGEGARYSMKPALGPGIYFSNCKNAASAYTKYAANKAIHKVELDTTNLYDQRNGTPHINKAFEEILKKLGKTEDDRPFRYDGVYGGLFRVMDVKSAIKMLVNHGIDGVFTRLPIGCYEISVINPNIIKKLDKELIDDNFKEN